MVESGYKCSGGGSSSASECDEVTGDGVLVGLEECDDGNEESGDGCSSHSKIEITHKCVNDENENPISTCTNRMQTMDLALVNLAGFLLQACLFLTCLLNFILTAKVSFTLWHTFFSLQII